MNETISQDALRKMYEEDKDARTIFDYFASRVNNSNETTVERLTTVLDDKGKPVSKSQIINILKNLDTLNCGEFIVGRRGKSSRFVWDVKMSSLGKAASGAGSQVEPVAAAGSYSQFEEDTQMIAHVYKIRPNVELTFQLPSDLTGYEASRLAAFIKTLPFEAAISTKTDVHQE